MKYLLYIVVAAALLAASPVQGQTPSRNVSRQASVQTDGEGYLIHLARPGETIYSLSRMYGVTRESLIKLNGLQGGLKAGTVIRIPAKSESARVENEVRAESVPEPESGDGLQEWGYRRSTGREIPRIALMLPLESTAGTAGNDFTELYKGALLALEDLKAAGHSLDVTLYNSARSAGKVRSIVTSSDFAETDLIIGPVFEEEMTPALQYAEFFNIPIVSPLATIGRLDGGMLYQMASDPSAKYDKLRDLWGGGKNIILVSSESGDDAEFEREITTELERAGMNYGRFTITEATGNNKDVAANFASLIDFGRENVFVVLAGTELALNTTLPTISTALARLARRANITVVGSSKWASYNNIEKNLFFRLNVRFVTQYYINRQGASSAHFERRFLEAYGDSPTRAAYRGYDAVALFGSALFEPGYSLDDRLARVGAAPLGTSYHFSQLNGNRRRVNDQWTLVRFGDDFNVTIR